MLAGARFGDYAPLSHPPGKQNLSQCVVDFMSAGMQEVFALEIDASPVRLFGEALSKKERRWTSRIIAQQPV